MLACVAGGMRERASGGRAAIYFFRAKPARNLRAAKPRVNFPPATFRMVFACRPLLSTLVPEVFFSLGETELSGEAAMASREAVRKKPLVPTDNNLTSMPTPISFD